MSVVPLWGRKVRQARLRGDRVARIIDDQETRITESVATVKALATQTELAAVELIRQGDCYLEAAARRR